MAETSYKGRGIETREYETADRSGWRAKCIVIERDGDSDLETEFPLRETFPTRASAAEAAIGVGQRKIDTGFNPGLSSNPK